MRAALGIFCLTALLALPAAAQPRPCLPEQECKQDPQCPIYRPGPVNCELGRGPLLFKTAQGSIQGSFVLQDWQIANDVTVEIPHQGWLIVHLRAGELVAEFGDERQEWHAGAFWSVPADRPLIIHTARDSVVLQTMDFITLR